MATATELRPQNRVKKATQPKWNDRNYGPKQLFAKVIAWNDGTESISLGLCDYLDFAKRDLRHWLNDEDAVSVKIVRVAKVEFGDVVFEKVIQ